MDLFRARTEDGKYLFAVAYEDWKNGKAGFAYLHATDRGDAMAQLLMIKSTGMISPTSRIVDVAPAIGVFAKKKEVIRVFT